MTIGTMLFNPFTGEPRHPSDIASDPRGVLIWDGEEPLPAAQTTAQAASEIELPEPVKFSDHPDIVGGVKWSDCELEFIGARDAKWHELLTKHIRAAWWAGYYHAGYTNDAAYADTKASEYAHGVMDGTK